MKEHQMVRFEMCEMEYRGGAIKSDLALVPFEAEYYVQYKSLIDDSFYEMRKARNIRPYEHYCDSLDALMEQKDNTFLLLCEDEIIGTVSCFGNEIENVAVSTGHRRQGFGRKLVEFAVGYLQNRGESPIKLTVAKLNESAIALYESLGFVVVREATVEGVSSKDADGNWTFQFTETEGLSIH